MTFSAWSRLRNVLVATDGFEQGGRGDGGCVNHREIQGSRHMVMLREVGGGIH